MNLSHTPDQQELKDAIRRFCAEQITPERLAAWEKLPRGIDESCWSMVGQLGWFGLGLPVACGGSGLGLADVGCLFEECGRGLVPLAVTNAMRGGLALAGLDPNAPELAAAARGELVVALAIDEAQARRPEQFAVRVTGGKKDSRISGEKWYVAEAAVAALHIVAARQGRGFGLSLVRGEDARCEPLRSFDGERQAVVRYDNAPVLRPLAAATEGRRKLAELQRQQLALSLAEMVGGMDAALAMTVEYVKQREQFGQKLAVFQAVQHQVADMAMAYTASHHLTWQAITRLAHGTEEGSELSTAAAFVGPAFKRVTLAAHHLHGGAGYVVEHPLHYYAERAQSQCIRHAPEATALAEVASALLD